jgi:hypothetical protein
MSNLTPFAAGIDAYLRGNMQGREMKRQRTLAEQAAAAAARQQALDNQFRTQQIDIQQQQLGMQKDKYRQERKDKLSTGIKDFVDSEKKGIQEEKDRFDKMNEKRLTAIGNMMRDTPVTFEEANNAVTTYYHNSTGGWFSDAAKRFGMKDFNDEQRRPFGESTQRKSIPAMREERTAASDKRDFELRQQQVANTEANRQAVLEIQRGNLQLGFARLNQSIAEAKTQEEKDALQLMKLGLEVQIKQKELSDSQMSDADMVIFKRLNSTIQKFQTDPFSMMQNPQGANDALDEMNALLQKYQLAPITQESIDAFNGNSFFGVPIPQIGDMNNPEISGYPTTTESALGSWTPPNIYVPNQARSKGVKASTKSANKPASGAAPSNKSTGKIATPGKTGTKPKEGGTSWTVVGPARKK